MLRRWSDCRAATRIRELEIALADAQSALDALKRELDVQIVECKTLAAVCARNHERVLRETAVEAARRAHAEGTTQHDRIA